MLNQVLKAFRWTIFGLVILHIAAFVWTITVAQKIPYEFDNVKLGSVLRGIIFGWLPLAILLTLLGTLRRTNTEMTNTIISVFTFLAAGYAYIFLYGTMFALSFGSWADWNIAYEKKDNPRIRIVEQEYDVGAFGYAGRRVVKLTPFLGIFNHVEEIDTNSIHKSEWNLVNKEGDVHFP